MRSLILLFVFTFAGGNWFALAELTPLEAEVIELCDSPYRMSFADGVFPSSDPPEADEQHIRANRLPSEAIPICLRILKNRENEVDSRRAGAMALLTLLVQKHPVAPGVKEEVHRSMLLALYERKWTDSIHIPLVGLQYLWDLGSESDLGSIIPFLDHEQPLIQDAAKFAYTAIIRRKDPNASFKTIIENARAQYRGQQAAAQPVQATAPNQASSTPTPLASAPVASATKASAPSTALLVTAAAAVVLLVGLLFFWKRRT
jgi:hypothetical protein